MGATMGQVPDKVLSVLGWGSIGVGAIIILLGTLLLIATVTGSFNVAKSLDAKAAVDVGKLLEALSKLPQWAVAVILGNLQMLMGFWFLGATLFGYKLLP
jgi:hypothetical protein